MTKAHFVVLSLLVVAGGRSGLAVAGEPAATPMVEGQGAQADAVQGKWRHPEQGVVMEIVKSGAGYEGKVVESTVPAAPVGKLLLRGVTYDAAKGEWRGEIFAVKRGEFVPMSAKLSGGRLVMTAGKGMFSKELTWPRA
jgi:uncharacterized protein (DUF2147 family)